MEQVGAGEAFSCALRRGEVLCWGDDVFGQCDVPAPNEDFVSVAGGFQHSVGLTSSFRAYLAAFRD